jgi:hypothetical protein
MSGFGTHATWPASYAGSGERTKADLRLAVSFFRDVPKGNLRSGGGGD